MCDTKGRERPDEHADGLDDDDTIMAQIPETPACRKWAGGETGVYGHCLITTADEEDSSPSSTAHLE